MSHKLKVLMVPTLNSGVVYWRMYNFWMAAHRTGAADFHVLWWQKDMKECHPWEVDVEDPTHSHRIFGELQAYALNADIIIVQMVHTPAGLSAFYALKDLCPNTPILTEIDDDIINTPSYNPASSVYRPGSDFTKTAQAQFKHSDAMIVSTPHLKEIYSEFCKNIVVVPNAIDLAAWRTHYRPNYPGFRVGWAGGSTHDDDLKSIEPVFTSLPLRCSKARFVMVHGVPPSLRENKDVRFISKWSRIDKYPRFLASLDFHAGIAPLVDNSFNRGKSNLRWLEYSALGIPCVASNVGHFAQTIHHLEDGYLADTPDDFHEYLERLYFDKKLRAKIGGAARLRVERDFNVDRVIFQYVDALKEIKERGVVATPPEIDRGVDWDDVKPLPPIPQEAQA